MCNSRLCVVFSLFFIISMYFGSVSGGQFDLVEAIGEVKRVLKSIYNFLGESNIDTTSIDNAGSLSALTSAADDFMSQNDIDNLKKLAENADTAASMSSVLFDYKKAFTKLLEADPNTKDKEVPLTTDIAAIAAVWSQ